MSWPVTSSLGKWIFGTKRPWLQIQWFLPYWLFQILVHFNEHVLVPKTMDTENRAPHSAKKHKLSSTHEWAHKLQVGGPVSPFPHRQRPWRCRLYNDTWKSNSFLNLCQKVLVINEGIFIAITSYVWPQTDLILDWWRYLLTLLFSSHLLSVMQRTHIDRSPLGPQIQLSIDCVNKADSLSWAWLQVSTKNSLNWKSTLLLGKRTISTAFVMMKA